jgi:hypothetical protein
VNTARTAQKKKTPTTKTERTKLVRFAYEFRPAKAAP